MGKSGDYDFSFASEGLNLKIDFFNTNIMKFSLNIFMIDHPLSHDCSFGNSNAENFLKTSLYSKLHLQKYIGPLLWFLKKKTCSEIKYFISIYGVLVKLLLLQYPYCYIYLFTEHGNTCFRKHVLWKRSLFLLCFIFFKFQSWSSMLIS